MSHSSLCKPHATLLGRIAHFLSSLFKPPNDLRSRSEYDDVVFKWGFGSWDYYPNRCNIDVSKRVTKKGKLSFNGPEAQPNEMTPMVQDLFQIRGVSSVTLFPYRVDIDKGGTFHWTDIQQPIEDVLRKHLVS